MINLEENFYNLLGEKIDRQVLVQEMIDYYNQKYPESNITDFNEGSEIRNLLEAIAVDVYHLMKVDNENMHACFLSTSYGQYLDLFGEDLNTPRNYGANAWGTVTFSIPEPINYTITIPYGTVLGSSVTGLNYLTNIDCEIPVGETSVECPVYSQVAGMGTNAEPNTITLFRDTIPYNMLSVTNIEAVTGGRDVESDDEYRSRLLSVKNNDGFGSKQYYTNLALSVDGVHDIIFTDATGYTAKIIVNGDNKPISDTVFNNLVTAFSNEANLVFKHIFTFEKVEYDIIPLEIELLVPYEVTNNMINNVLKAFFDGGEYNGVIYNGLSINEKLYRSSVINAIESINPNVQVTSLTSSNSQFVSLTPDNDSVFQLGTVHINAHLIEG